MHILMKSCVYIHAQTHTALCVHAHTCIYTHMHSHTGTALSSPCPRLFSGLSLTILLCSCVHQGPLAPSSWSLQSGNWQTWPSEANEPYLSLEPKLCLPGCRAGHRPGPANRTLCVRPFCSSSLGTPLPQASGSRPHAT